MNRRTFGRIVLVGGATAALALGVLSQHERIADLVSWENVYANTKRYKDICEPEFVFQGRLEKVEEEITSLWVYPNGTRATAKEGQPQPLYTNGVSWYWYYFLTEPEWTGQESGFRRPVIAHGSLKKYVGKMVEIRGKSVVPEQGDVKLEGYTEIWPGKIREARDSSKP